MSHPHDSSRAHAVVNPALPADPNSPGEMAPAEAQAVRDLAGAYKQMTAQIGKVIVGQQKVIEQLLDHFRLADDNLADLLGHLLVRGGEVTDNLGFLMRSRHERRVS